MVTYLFGMGHLRRSSTKRRAELTDAALHIIATRGVVALSTRSLAERVGLTGGAIFRHFASLDDLLDAVVTRVEEVLDATYPLATLPPLERLERFIEARSATVGGQVGILRLVVSEQFLFALPKSGSKRLMACVEKTRAFVTTCLVEAQAAGQVRADLAPESLAPVVMGTIQMLALSASQPRPRIAAQRVRDSLIALLRPPPTTRKITP